MDRESITGIFRHQKLIDFLFQTIRQFLIFPCYIGKLFRSFAKLHFAYECSFKQKHVYLRVGSKLFWCLCFYPFLLFATSALLSRLGFLVDFLSHAAIVGFMAGAAIVIGLQQLKGLLGINHFTNKTDVVSVIKWHYGNFLIGCAFLIFILATYGACQKSPLASLLSFVFYNCAGSFSRTAVNFSAGCKTTVSNIVMAVTVFIALQLLTRLLYYTPVTILASIILSALPGLIDVKEVCNIWEIDKMDFLTCIGAFLGVLFGSVEIGLSAAVIISFAKIIIRSIPPHIEMLGRIQGTDIFCSIRQYPTAAQAPGVLLIRIDSSFLCFMNANFIRERITRWVMEECNPNEKKPGEKSHSVVIDMSNVMNIDTSGTAALGEMHKELLFLGIQFAIANPGWQAIHKMKRAGLVECIGGEWIFLTVDEAVKACMVAKDVACA